MSRSAVDGHTRPTRARLAGRASEPGRRRAQRSRV